MLFYISVFFSFLSELLIQTYNLPVFKRKEKHMLSSVLQRNATVLSVMWCKHICLSLSVLFPLLKSSALPRISLPLSDGLNAENNDDRVLQCCLQYQSLYPECAVILCTWVPPPSLRRQCIAAAAAAAESVSSVNNAHTCDREWV